MNVLSTGLGEKNTQACRNHQSPAYAGLDNSGQKVQAKKQKAAPECMGSLHIGWDLANDFMILEAMNFCAGRVH